MESQAQNQEMLSHQVEELSAVVSQRFNFVSILILIALFLFLQVGQIQDQGTSKYGGRYGISGRKGKKGRSNSYEKKKVGGPFIADIFTKELKTGKLPFKQNEERIARYGKGFSNLLTMAGNPNSNVNPQSYQTQTQPTNNNSLHEDSIISNDQQEGYTTQGNSIDHDDLETESKEAAYAIYRPEIRNMPDPYTYREALRHYRDSDNPSMEEYQRQMRRRVM